MRQLNFSDVKNFSGRRIPAVMEMVPMNKEGNKTVIRYETIEFNIPIGKEIFSLRHLRTWK